MLKVTTDVPPEPFAFGPVLVVLLAAVTAAVVLVVSRRAQGSQR